MDSACVYCSTGTCLTQFGDCAAEGQMRKWHREWSLISRGEQDIHLLWMFYAGSGNCVNLLPGAFASSRIDTSSVDDDSPVGGEDRIPTSSDDGNSSVTESDEEALLNHPVRNPVVSTAWVNQDVLHTLLNSWAAKYAKKQPCI